MHHLIRLTHAPDFAEIFIAELSEQGYEAFEETPEGVLAYIPSELYQAHVLEEMQAQYADFLLAYTVEEVAQQNWNAQWEASYEPVIVAGKCLIKSSFHEILTTYPYEILINPKMSFGTGHHETTTLMLEHILELELAGKAVLDAGCGTGILAILAYMRGAGKVEGFDIEEWAVENAQENAILNHCPDLKIWLGTIESVALPAEYDLLIANIQRNVLLAEMHEYAARMKKGGTLLLSGFYQKDVQDLLACAAAHGFTFRGLKIRNDWVALNLHFS